MKSPKVDTPTQKTKDLSTIRRWTEERGGEPALLRERVGTEKGLLAVVFPETPPPIRRLYQTVSWKEFGEVFEDRELVFNYQPESSSRHSVITSERTIPQVGMPEATRHYAQRS